MSQESEMISLIGCGEDGGVTLYVKHPEQSLAGGAGNTVVTVAGMIKKFVS